MVILVNIRRLGLRKAMRRQSQEIWARGGREEKERRRPVIFRLPAVASENGAATCRMPGIIEAENQHNTKHRNCLLQV
jgi:hypothetical protein